MVAVLLGLSGLFAISSTWSALWAMWMTDPLKSIGCLVPLVSLVLILRAWRSTDWSTEGNWWGLAVLATTIAVVHLRDQAVLELVLSPSWSITLPPHSMIAVAYATGVVLFFGGVRLLRAARFPVVLMWFVNPVPHIFNRYVDLPLQHASAVIARSFAHALGQTLTPDRLHLMFTPQFGMFIAPGCDGIRGAITMALIALVAGHLYRLRPRHWILLTIGALLLGYAFNFVRLCGLVVYYVIALRSPWLQNHASIADYTLGAVLFFVAAMLLFSLLLRWSPNHTLRLPHVAAKAQPAADRSHLSSFLARCTAFVVLSAVGSLSYARAVVRASAYAPSERVAPSMPRHVGRYTLSREWDERLATGPVLFHWAEYVDAAGGRAVSLGLSPTLGAHDTLLCHAARGDTWLWHGPLRLATVSGAATLSASLFNDGATQSLEASSICAGSMCEQSSTQRRHFGLIYSRPSPRALLTQTPTPPTEILLRAAIPDATLPAPAARTELTRHLGDFLANIDLAALARSYRAE
jgi:exosortase J